MIRAIVKAKIKGVGLVCSYQEPVLPIIRNSLDKFHKLADLIIPEKEYVMNSFTEEQEIKDLIINHLIVDKEVVIIDIDKDLIKIILQKSFKGVALFVIELIDAFFEKNLIRVVGTTLLPSTDLMEMHKNIDWKAFNLPIRYEKTLGQIIDTLGGKEIIILKHASAIGNLFDLGNLNKIIPFNNIDEDDLYRILRKFEVNTGHY